MIKSGIRSPHPSNLKPQTSTLAALAALGAGYLVADYWRMRRVAESAHLPYHPIGFRATLTGPGQGGPLRYLALGDSTAHGIGAATPEGSAPYGVAQALTAHYSPITFANVAISGATSADILRVQIPQVAEFQPDLVTLFVGPNDVTHLRSRAAYLADMDRLLAALDAVPAAVATNVCAVRLCPVLTPVFRLLVDLQCRRFNAALPAVVARHRVRLATLNPDLVPPFAADPQGLYAADGYHPNDAGYRLWTDYLAPRVLAALADPGSIPPRS
jgi:lysophospholipase L1-like esterase